MKKTTLATIKSFIKKNRANLHILTASRFDGMDDCVRSVEGATFVPALQPDEGRNFKNCLGVHGAWFVFGSRDWFYEYNENGFIGYVISNCCGKFILAIPQQAAA